MKNTSNKKFFSFIKYHKPLCLGISAFVIIIIFAIILISNLNSYERVIRAYLDIEILGKTENIYNLVPEGYIEKYYTDAFIEGTEDSIEYIQKNLIDNLGDNVSYSFNITKEEKLSKSDYNNLCNYLKSQFNIAKKEVGKAYNIEFDCTIKGDNDIGNIDMNTIVIQIYGNWYLMSYSYDTWDFSISNLNDYEYVIHEYLGIGILGKTENILDMVPEKYLEKNYDDKNKFKVEIENNIEYIQKNLIHNLGDNLSYTFDITKEEKLSKSEYNNLCNYLKSQFDIAKKEIGKAYIIEFDCIIEGDNDIENNCIHILAVQIYDKWYLMNYNSYLNNWYFLI